MKRWVLYGFGCYVFVCGLPVLAAGAEKSPPAPDPAGERVFSLQVRVIFGSSTGIQGDLGDDLTDMKELLLENFQYPAYERSNTIRLSLFGEEEATALVFPDHYLRVISKGVTKDGRLRVKVELYQVSPEEDSKTKVYVGVPPNVISYQEKEKEGSHSPVFPIAASAMILAPRRWEAFGGVPIRVNAQGRVSSNTMSTSPFRSPAVSPALGAPKYLILGIQMEEEK